MKPHRMFQGGTWAGLLLLALSVGQGAQAAPLNLVKTYPDFVLASDQAYTYTYNAGLGQGTLTIVGTVASYTEKAGAGGIDNALVTCGLTGGLTGSLDCTNKLDRFSLTAVLSNTGQVLSGSFSLNGLVRYPGATPLYDGFAHSSGHLLSGDLTNFGWGGNVSPSSGGTLEFTFGNADGRIATGPWTELGAHPPFLSGGMILTVSSSTLGAGNFGANALTNSWTGSGYGDVFVPVPAAIWLLGSGLAALGGVRSLGRRRSTN